MQIGDMSLADNATLCLSAVITQLAFVKAGEQIYKDIVQHTILDAVLKGLRSKTEVATHTSPPISKHSIDIKTNAVNSLPVLSFTLPECAA